MPFALKIDGQLYDVFVHQSEFAPDLHNMMKWAGLSSLKSYRSISVVEVIEEKKSSLTKVYDDGVAGEYQLESNGKLIGDNCYSCVKPSLAEMLHNCLCDSERVKTFDARVVKVKTIATTKWVEKK